jgi:hypothetical protein
MALSQVQLEHRFSISENADRFLTAANIARRLRESTSLRRIPPCPPPGDANAVLHRRKKYGV